MKQAAKTQLRLPTDLHTWVVQFAADNNRSMNSQIVSILREAKKHHDQQTAVASVVLGG